MAVAPRVLRVLAFGDSITGGWTSFMSGGTDFFRTHLESVLNDGSLNLGCRVFVTADGEPGATAMASERRLRSALRRTSYDVTLILLGASDLSMHNMDDSTSSSVMHSVLRDLKLLHMAAREAGAFSVAVGILDHPRMRESAAALTFLHCMNEQMKACTCVGADAYIEGLSLLSAEAGPNLWSADGVHLERPGFEALTRAMGTALLEILTRPGAPLQPSLSEVKSPACRPAAAAAPIAAPPPEDEVEVTMC